MRSARIFIEAQERGGGLDGGVQAIESAPEDGGGARGRLASWGRGCGRRESTSCRLPRAAVERVGRLVAERLMRALQVVEGQVAPNADARLDRAVVRVQIHLLVLERAPQTLDEDVVEAA